MALGLKNRRDNHSSLQVKHHLLIMILDAVTTGEEFDNGEEMSSS